MLTIINGAVINCRCNGKKVVIPESFDGATVTSIKTYAFNQCKDLTQVILPNTITDIEDGAFNCCFKLQPFNLPKSINAKKPFQCCGIIDQFGRAIDGSNLTFDSVRAGFFNSNNIVRSMQDGKFGLYDAENKVPIVPPIFNKMHVPINGPIEFEFNGCKFNGYVRFRENFIEETSENFKNWLIKTFENNCKVNNSLLGKIHFPIQVDNTKLLYFESPNWGVEIWGDGPNFEQLKQLL